MLCSLRTQGKALCDYAIIGGHFTGQTVIKEDVSYNCEAQYT